MNDKLVDFLIDKTDQLGGFIDELAKQMGVAAEHVYSVLIRQQYVEGIGKLIWSVPLFLALVGFGIYLISLDVRKKLDRSEAGIGYLLGVVAIGVATVILTFQTTLGVQMLLNPEYYAIQDLMEMIGNLTGAEKSND